MLLRHWLRLLRRRLPPMPSGLDSETGVEAVRHRVLVHSGDQKIERYALVNVEADRIVNSLNTLSEQVGEHVHPRYAA